MINVIPKVLFEREGYRFVEKGILQINGKPDYRLQKKDWYTKRWNDIYLFDNGMQCSLAMEDINYARWLDPDRVPAYVKGDEDTDGL
jgi:hypothetical protein